MERDILASVIEVESEIKKRLDAERKKIEEWLNKTQKETEEDRVREEIKLKEAFNEALETEIRNAEERAFKILNNAKAKADKLENLHDEILREIISKYIIRILPGETHDSPDVKG